ncbi:MAG: tRNA pseudouridine(38-40) synthase TruA [Chloracidobacterium sp.]|uniref:tRNA pseudouridine synthase A n=1 Tax=Chloracidobacterium validum TaxID=2821543 RepID=A0ABX8BAZ0_9BACT|nr:tRNA pseudouridine(38-40) synthase TruA [Chloracidobacterium validum]QUW02803.1 tRNA pseudouridine(38-40) synthase TruA [Chloracidobacterium validum]
MPRLKLTIEYDGTAFAGWQTQANAPTIQSALAAAFTPLLGHPAQLHAAGRTDAGVHALGQVVHTDVAPVRPPETWRAALNAHLPDDIRVRQVEVVGADFHARKSARAKLYHYAFWRGQVESPRWRRYSLLVPMQLDWEAMREASAYFVGRHDFAPFSVADRTVQTSIRTIHRVMWFPPPAGAATDDHDPLRPAELVAVAFHGDGFLRYQVRRMVGTLLAVGQRKVPPEAVRQILCLTKQFAVGPTAPAQGLTLMRVDY